MHSTQQGWWFNPTTRRSEYIDHRGQIRATVSSRAMNANDHRFGSGRRWGGAWVAFDTWRAEQGFVQADKAA